MRRCFSAQRVAMDRVNSAIMSSQGSEYTRVHYSDGRTGRVLASEIHQRRSKNNENSLPDSTIERRRKVKERYKALIRPSKRFSQRRTRQTKEIQQQLLNEDNSHSSQLTPKQSNMKGESTGEKSTTIHRTRSISSIEYRSTSPSAFEKDIATAATVQTTSTLTEHSSSYSSQIESRQTVASTPAIVSPSLSCSSQTPRSTIETDISNLTESTFWEEPVRLNKTKSSFKKAEKAGDQVLASIARLQEIEQKRSIMRDQRFNLEQRLHSFRKVATTREVVSNEEERKKVLNWKYKTSEEQTLFYTGHLDECGEPNDDDALLRFGDEQIYKGGVLNGMRHGSGTNQWPDGQTYSGEWQNDSRNGRGTHIWKDGRTVTGNWKNGHLHGKIYFRWPNGAVFDGSACMGKKEGKGVTTRPDGTVYNGNYSGGKENGFGTLIRPDGSKYRGEFKNGMKEGHGVMLRSSQTYDGEWLKDKPHGQGRVVWPNGAMYNGQFQSGTYSGMGVYVWPSGKRYAGHWEKGVKHGHGVHTWPSGQVYDGAYSKGVREGYGRMTWPDGSVYCGGFQSNQRCGQGVQTDSNGAVVHCGLWKHDHPTGGSGDHEAKCGLKSQLKKDEKKYGVENSGHQPKVDLPSFSCLQPAVLTPREEDNSTCDEEGFPIDTTVGVEI